MANNRQRGKHVERQVAKKVGGRRVGVLGREDVEHPMWSIEVKMRKRFVAEKWMSQAVRNCPDGKIPLVLVHLPGQRYENSFVVMRMRDFKKR